MDHKGPEHHYNQNESPENGRTVFWQQGEIAPDHVKGEGDFHGEGRPYRSQPNPIEDEMDRYRDMPLDGVSDDEGGNQFRTDKGILASKQNEEDLEQLDEATEPKGLGETNPVKDHDWASGEITSRPARDEMLGSVRKASEDEDELWDEVVEDFEEAEGGEVEDSTEKIAAASWLENDGQDSGVPVEHLGWDIVDVVEPSKEYTEAANKYTMPLPQGITDNLHEALIKLNAWVENPEENGKLRPYKDYWSVIRPKISEGNIQIGVENPHMADLINHVARTDDLSSLDKTSMNKTALWPLAGLAARLATPLVSRIAMPAISRVMGGAASKGIGSSIARGLGTSLLGGGGGGGRVQQPAQEQVPSTPQWYSSYKNSIYGDHFDHPSTVSERNEDPENGKLFPNTRTQTVDGPLGDQEWQKDYTEVNEVGQSRDIRGDDYEKHNLKRVVQGSEEYDQEKAEKAIQAFLDALPIIMEYFNSEESGEEDETIRSVHNGLEDVFPGYLDLEDADDDNELMLIFKDFGFKTAGYQKHALDGMDQSIANDATNEPIARDNADHCMKCNAPVDPSRSKEGGPILCAQHAADQSQAGVQGVDASPDSVNKEFERWGIPTNNNQNVDPQTQQLLKQFEQLGNMNITASDTQGPHTNEQQAAVAEYLIEEGREDEIPNMLENPADYDSELAEMQNKQPMLDESPEDIGMGAQDQMAQMGMGPEQGGSPAGPPMGGEMPPGLPGAAPGIPDMSAPTPADLNPAGPGAMPPPIMSSVTSSMLDAAFKYGADNVAGACPKCDGHTTKMMQQDGKSKCHSCGHEWADETFQKSDGDSSHSVTTSSFYAALDSFVEEEPEPEIDESSHTWTDEDGEPIQEGQEYEIYASNYEIPDIGRVVEVKPDAIVYEIESDGGLRTTIEIDRQEADLNGYRFAPTSSGDVEENRSGFGIEDKIAPEPGQTTDLATPHREIGASAKKSTAQFYMCPEPNCEFNKGGGDYEPGKCSIHNVDLVPAGQSHDDKTKKTAGKHYTPMEQRELIDEYGQARNADKLNLEGTHYADSDPDYFLFGC